MEEERNTFVMKLEKIKKDYTQDLDAIEEELEGIRQHQDYWKNIATFWFEVDKAHVSSSIYMGRRT